MNKRNKQSRRLRILSVVIISFVLIFTNLGVIEGHAAMSSYMEVNNVDVAEGNIEGDVTQLGRENMHSVYAIEHHIEIPRDPHTGLPTGQRIHHPFIVTTNVNQGLPFFYQILTTGSQSTISIDYYRIADNGVEELYFTILLEDAIMVNIQHNKLNILNPDNKPFPDMVSVSFTYSKITW